MNKKLQPYHFYYYTWIDSFINADWIYKKDIDEEIKKGGDKIEGVGAFVKETTNFYVFTSGFDNERIFDLEMVPKKAVLKVVPLEEKHKIKIIV